MTPRLSGTANVLTAAYLLLAGYAKATDLPSFISAVEGQGLIPPSWVHDAGVLIPLIEIVIASAALWWTAIRRHPPAGVLLAAAYLGLGAYSFGLWLIPPQRPVPCGCGLSDALVTHWLIPASLNLGVAFTLLGLASLAGARSHAAPSK